MANTKVIGALHVHKTSTEITAARTILLWNELSVLRSRAENSLKVLHW